MVTRAELVAVARTWIGTPVRHQGRAKRVGVDCVGLIIGVCRELRLEPYASFETGPYNRVPNGRTLRRLCDQAMDPVAPTALRPADVLLLKLDWWAPQHLAFVGVGPDERLTMIHAALINGRVVEHRIAPATLAQDLVGGYALRGLED